MMSAVGCFWGIPRTARSVAMAIVARQRGLPLTLDQIERIILEELDAADLPQEYAATLIVQLTNGPDKEERNGGSK